MGGGQQEGGHGGSEAQNDQGGDELHSIQDVFSFRGVELIFPFVLTAYHRRRYASLQKSYEPMERRIQNGYKVDGTVTMGVDFPGCFCYNAGKIS